MAALALAGTSHAQTVIEITGATAFRSAAPKAINAIYNAGGPFVAVHNGGLNGGTYQAWRGTFGTLGSDVTIRTSWNGSVEGIRAVAQPGNVIDGLPTNANYLNTTILDGLTPAASGNIVGVNTSGNVSAAVAEMAFSDVLKESTPVPGSLSGGAVGVQVFTMVANKTWRDDSRTSGITNITSQQYRALLSQGKVKLSFFTGNASDTDLVYATGRNDGSGTRTTYLAESGYGISKLVKQYVAFNSTGSTINSILLVPPGGGFASNGTATPTNLSSVWSQDADGNGGYASGSTLRGDLAKTTANTSVRVWSDADFDDVVAFSELVQQAAPAPLFLVTWLSISDAATARGDANLGAHNAAILGYDGVRLESLAATGNATLTAADKAKVQNGTYTAWGNEQLLYLSGNGTLTTAFNAISGNIATTLTEGVPLTQMNVSRGADGGIVTP